MDEHKEHEMKIITSNRLSTLSHLTMRKHGIQGGVPLDMDMSKQLPKKGGYLYGDC